MCVAADPVLSLSDVHTFYQGFAAQIPESYFQNLQKDDLIKYIGWCLALYHYTPILTQSLYKNGIAWSPPSDCGNKKCGKLIAMVCS